jgi:hypothetical protein
MLKLYLKEGVCIMKRHLVGAILLIAGFITLQAQMPPQPPPMKLEDVQKALCLVDKTQPVPDKYKTGFEAITPKDTMAMLAYLSSDWMEGRETGTPGYSQAADYAASLFKMWGLKPAGDFPPAPRSFMRPGVTPPPAPERSYFQNIAFKEISNVRSTITVEVAKGPSLKTKVFTGGVDFAPGGGAAESISAPVVFVGYGISEPSIGFDELKGLDLKGKIVLMLTEAPGKNNPQSPFQANKELKEKYFPMFRGFEMMMRRGGPPRFNKIDEITKRGAAAVVLVDNAGKDTEIFRRLSEVRKPSDDRPIIEKPRTRFMIAGDVVTEMGPMSGGFPVTVTREIANTVLEGSGQTIDDLKNKIETTMKPVSFNVPGTKLTLTTTANTTLMQSPNVLGLIEGSDPELKNECFVIGAHFDHLGKWEKYIFNGADDNGSGSAGVLAIARAIAQNPVKPKRTILFALWTGEEKGLYGSRYYVTNPFFPIEKTVGYLNYDMISRSFDEAALARAVRRYNVPGAEDMVKKIRGDRFTDVFLTGGTDFPALTREMNAYVGLDLAFEESPLGEGFDGSDHSAFASVKIPYVYFMAAMTSDYHQTSDSAEKVNADLFTKICQIGYLTAFAFADK